MNEIDICGMAQADGNILLNDCMAGQQEPLELTGMRQWNRTKGHQYLSCTKNIPQEVPGSKSSVITATRPSLVLRMSKFQ